MIIKEICVNNLKEALYFNNKADRIELCFNLKEGGVSPSYGTLIKAKELIFTPIVVMIRPRAGNFVYTKEEKEIMIEEAKLIKSLGFKGAVFGALTEDNQIDIEFCKIIIEILGDTMENTFHMAFDFIECKKQFDHDINDNSDTIKKSIRIIKELGFTRILSRGGKEGTAYSNYLNLLKYQDIIDELNSNSLKNNNNQNKSDKDKETTFKKLILLPGGGINSNNIEDFMEITENRFKELHGSRLLD